MPIASCRGRCVLLRPMLTTSHSISAPEINRIVVKLAASMPVCFSAARHSRELPANAIMASEVRKIRRGKGIESFPGQQCSEGPESIKAY